MPRIFDNIDQQLLPCASVGYFNLRGSAVKN
jgi:hypothetical protein